MSSYFFDTSGLVKRYAAEQGHGWVRSLCDPHKVVRVTNAIYNTAGDLCRVHKLRAYDAVQLACAITIRAKGLSSNKSLPIFVCADSDLLNMASSEGLPIENPNNRPN